MRRTPIWTPAHERGFELAFILRVSPASAWARVDVEQAATVVLEAADPAMRAQERGHSADVAEHPEVYGIAGKMMRVGGAADCAVVRPASARGIDAQASECRCNLMHDRAQAAVEAAGACRPADIARRLAMPMHAAALCSRGCAKAHAVVAVSGAAAAIGCAVASVRCRSRAALNLPRLRVLAMRVAAMRLGMPVRVSVAMPSRLARGISRRRLSFRPAGPFRRSGLVVFGLLCAFVFRSRGLVRIAARERIGGGKSNSHAKREESCQSECSRLGQVLHTQSHFKPVSPGALCVSRSPQNLAPGRCTLGDASTLRQMPFV